MKFEIKDGFVFEVTETYECMLGQVVHPFLIDENKSYEEYEVKKWNMETCKYESIEETSYTFKDVEYTLVDGCFKVYKSDPEPMAAAREMKMEQLEEKLNKIMEHLGI